jgi:hypothetical protein
MRALMDRHGIPVELGQSVRIAQCVGPHGIMQTLEGVIEAIHLDGGIGVELALTAPAYQHMRDRREPRAIGSRMYVAAVGRPQGDVFVWHSVLEDVEHGHEAWLEVTAHAQRLRPRPRG